MLFKKLDNIVSKFFGNWVILLMLIEGDVSLQNVTHSFRDT
jgi:hypothetical protein